MSNALCGFSYYAASTYYVKTMSKSLLSSQFTPFVKSMSNNMSKLCQICGAIIMLKLCRIMSKLCQILKTKIMGQKCKKQPPFWTYILFSWLLMLDIVMSAPPPHTHKS